jgi:hypothetical protein
MLAESPHKVLALRWFRDRTRIEARGRDHGEPTSMTNRQYRRCRVTTQSTPLSVRASSAARASSSGPSRSPSHRADRPGYRRHLCVPKTYATRRYS